MGCQVIDQKLFLSKGQYDFDPLTPKSIEVIYLPRPMHQQSLGPLAVKLLIGNCF
jgi:hypothetical protein